MHPVRDFSIPDDVKDSWARYWADLVNLGGDFSTMRDADVDRWLKRRVLLWSRSRGPTHPGGQRGGVLLGASLRIDVKAATTTAGMPKSQRPFFVEQQRSVHRFAHDTLRPMINGTETRLPPRPERTPVSAKISASGHTEVRIVGLATWPEFHWLHDTLRDRTIFPIGACPKCSKAFAREGPGRPRQYCSEQCATATFEAARGGTEERKAQLRRAQQKRRDGNSEADA